ncbi:MAG TPA: hypothetical protein VHL78_03565 [Actinomycetota bacterium]|nr:hypothetical protein [Actinomycetota bacterium]
MAISYQQGRLGAGDNADRGTTEVVFQMAPGDVAVRCSSSVGGDDPPYASFEVVDPKGLYVPAELDCGPLQGISTGHGDYIEGTPGDRRDPLLVATERWSPLEPGEEVQRAGYPRAENRLVLLVRDGRVVEVLEFARDDAGVGWLESSLTTCSERIG